MKNNFSELFFDVHIAQLIIKEISHYAAYRAVWRRCRVTSIKSVNTGIPRLLSIHQSVEDFIGAGYRKLQLLLLQFALSPQKETKT